MLLYSGFWNSLPKQLRQSTPHQPTINQTDSTLTLSSLSFMWKSKRSSPTDRSLLSLYMHYHLCQFSGFSTRQCSSSHIYFLCYHSPSHHLFLVSENKPTSVIAVLVGFDRHSKCTSYHSHSSFILCGVIIIIIIIFIRVGRGGREGGWRKNGKMKLNATLPERLSVYGPET